MIDSKEGSDTMTDDDDDETERAPHWRLGRPPTLEKLKIGAAATIRFMELQKAEEEKKKREKAKCRH
jgi:hypothetical protein